MASPDQSRKEGGAFSAARTSCRSRFALAVGHVHGRSPEDEEDVLHRWEAAGVPVPIILLGLAFLRGGVAVVLLEHVALLEGVVVWDLVVRA
jgi:hypothetical protein